MSQPSMFYGARPKIFEIARELRSNMTQSETILWEKLKKNQLLGLRFKPQHPIDKYVVDFYCHKLKLVTEVDGEIHNDKENSDYDIGRMEDLHELGIKVIRFTNQQVKFEMGKTLSIVSKICEERLNNLDGESPL